MIDSKPESIEELIRGITPEIYQSLKTAIELGKWESGVPLSKKQTEYCLQAIIAWENHNVGPEHRVGYLERNGQGATGVNETVRDRVLATDRKEGAGSE